MTPYQKKFLDHCVQMSHVDKHFAWSAAKKYAQMDAYELSELPEMLTQEMKRLQKLKEQQTGERTIEVRQARGR